MAATRPSSARVADDRTRKRLLAIEVLLEVPEAISDGLEAELYALHNRPWVVRLPGPVPLTDAGCVLDSQHTCIRAPIALATGLALCLGRRRCS